MQRLLAALVIIRALCGPVIVAAAAVRAPGAVLAFIVTVAFLSAASSAIIARRVAVTSRTLRHAEAIVDTVFYSCATVALVARTSFRLGLAMCIAAIVALELARWGLDRLRYGRMALYHLWSAKAWGVLLWLGFSEAFVRGRIGPWFEVAVIVGMLSEVEALGASVVLSEWQRDVHTLWHAVQIERGDQREA